MGFGSTALFVTLMSGASTLSGAQTLLASETQGLSIDFTDAAFVESSGVYGSAYVVDET